MPISCVLATFNNDNDDDDYDDDDIAAVEVDHWICVARQTDAVMILLPQATELRTAATDSQYMRYFDTPRPHETLTPYVNMYIQRQSKSMPLYVYL